ncbi:hypothetical protein LSAT2_024342 [Lamellibrachia satsuma]|nr:hypothetical protein LSAT2_024342 [Lamellibrachia satsuma]
MILLLLRSALSFPSPVLKAEEIDLSEVSSGGEKEKTGWFEAVNADDVKAISAKLQQCPACVNMVDENGWCALHLAAWNGNTQLISVLLDHPLTDINFFSPGGSTALALAAQQGHTGVIIKLLAAKCDVHRTATLGGCEGVTALHLAAQHGHACAVQLLVDAGASTDASITTAGVRGMTPLHLAVQSEQLDVIDILIKAGCNIHQTTEANVETHC